MSPTKEEITNIFNQIDKDHSGSVDPQELYTALGLRRKLIKVLKQAIYFCFTGKNNFSQKEIALLVANLDKDKDGKIGIKGIYYTASYYLVNISNLLTVIVF